MWGSLRLAPIIQSQLVREVFAASSQLVYTTVGYNSTFKSCHLKLYTEQDHLCAAFIRDVRLAPDINNHLLKKYFMSVHALLSLTLTNYYNTIFIL